MSTEVFEPVAPKLKIGPRAPITLKSTFYIAGYCEHRGSVTMKGDSRDLKKYPATCVLLRHPDGSNILFDTGYSTRFHQDTNRFPYSLYAKLTPVYVKAKDEIISQLKRDGLSSEDISLIILSHFHADHMGGLLDFPTSEIVGSGHAYDQVRKLNGFSAVRRGLVPAMLPHDFERRFQPVEHSRWVDISDRLPGFRNAWDVLGEGSIFAVPLPGHARGQFGIYYIDSEHGETFLIADATWSSEAYREYRMPSRFAYLAFDDRRAYDRTFSSIHHLHRLRPEIRIIPTHCPETWKLAQTGQTPMTKETSKNELASGKKALIWNGPDVSNEYWSQNGLQSYAIKPGNWFMGKSYETLEAAMAAAEEHHDAFVARTANQIKDWLGPDYYPTPSHLTEILSKTSGVAPIYEPCAWDNHDEVTSVG